MGFEKYHHSSSSLKAQPGSNALGLGCHNPLGYHCTPHTALHLPAGFFSLHEDLLENSKNVSYVPVAPPSSSSVAWAPGRVLRSVGEGSGLSPVLPAE